MANVRKPIIENPVYCEIIFRLGTHKRYANEFVDFFKDDFNIFSNKIHKKQSVLARQMKFLNVNGYLNKIEDEGGKKLKNNKKMYFVNFDKIIDIFFEYYNKKLNDKYNQIVDKKKYKKNFEDVLKKIKNKKFIDKSKKNIFVKYLFRLLIEEPRQIHLNLRDLTLFDLFEVITVSNKFSYLVEKIEKDIVEDLDNKKGIEIKVNEKISNYVKKDFRSDFDFFIFEFLSAFHIESLSHYIDEILPSALGNVALNGFDKEKIKFYNL